MKDLNLNIEVINLAPLTFVGRCGEVEFTILEVAVAERLTGSEYLLSGSDGFSESYFTLKSALQDCYLNWG
jgi:hypothetical protein